MKPSGTPPAPVAASDGFDDKETGLPILKTWPSVYVFVFIAFVLCVLLLTVLTQTFS